MSGEEMGQVESEKKVETKGEQDKIYKGRGIDGRPWEKSREDGE